jgi:UDP-3-O-[3-hydroxymyristoyl] glucosamine N-acyltransferase
MVCSVATLSRAEPGTISFLANTRYRKLLESTRASAVILSAEDESHCPVPALIHPNPYLAYAQIAGLLHPEVRRAPGIHPSAVVGPRARVAASASIGPLAVVEDDCEIGERVAIGPGCIVQA